MKNFNISLYGNLIVDTVYKVRNFQEGGSTKCTSKYKSLGGLANVARELLNLNDDTNLSVDAAVGNDDEAKFCRQWFSNKEIDYSLQKIDNHPTSNAVIFVDSKKNIRSSVVEWGACQHYKFEDSRSSYWKHFLYADSLNNITENDLKKASENAIVSVDFCLSSHTPKQRQKVYSFLKYVDYLFISDVESRSITGLKDLKSMSMHLGKEAKGVCILHDPQGSYISDGLFYSEVKTDFLENIELDVLGAGDVFTASFIDHSIKNPNEEYVKVAEFAHTNTTKYLLNNKEDKND